LTKRLHIKLLGLALKPAVRPGSPQRAGLSDPRNRTPQETGFIPADLLYQRFFKTVNKKFQKKRNFPGPGGGHAGTGAFKTGSKEASQKPFGRIPVPAAPLAKLKLGRISSTWGHYWRYRDAAFVNIQPAAALIRAAHWPG
jgi:hypothetical protein